MKITNIMNNQVPFSRTNISRNQEDDANESRRDPLGPLRVLGPTYNPDILAWQAQTLRNTRITPVGNGIYECRPVETASGIAHNHSGTSVSLDTRSRKDDVILAPHDNARGTQNMASTNHTETTFRFGDSQSGVSARPGTSLQFNQRNGACTAFQQYNSSTGNNDPRGSANTWFTCGIPTIFIADDGQQVNHRGPEVHRSMRRRPREAYPQTPIGAVIPGKYERQHPCRYPECSIKCATAHARDRHERCHDSWKPYKCSTCGKTFNRKDSKLRHEREVSCREQSQEARGLANGIFSYRNPQC
ncbi:hypothetical protein BJV82DRAFT_238002 [Fennellomyces sp. T-0311]|nr:hypothetical protein BJV82DRAFT_238002 [Fennellomyces sp. T-0311]